MVLIHLVEIFKPFYDFSERCSAQQQQQLLDAFTAQIEGEVQLRFYECWNQLAASALEAKPEPIQNPIQESVKPLNQNRWVCLKTAVRRW